MIASKYSFKLLFPDKKNRTVSSASSSASAEAQVGEVPQSGESDSKKRSFLKLAGVVGVGAAATMLIPKKAEAFVFGSSPTTGVVGVKDSGNNRINPAKEDGNLATIATQTGLMSFDAGSNPANLLVKISSIAPGADIGIQNAANVTINPAQEDGNLATLTSSAGTIVTNTSKLTSLNFDGSGNLLTAAAGGSASAVGLKDTTSTLINPATDDGVTYLRRIVKLMESQAVVDNANRQRITIDSLGTGTAITNTVPVSGTVTATVTAATVTSVATVTNMTTLAGQNQQMFQDFAKTAYATGIRQNLIFS